MLIFLKNTHLSSKKFTVNHEYMPSSTPSMIVTESLFVLNGDFLKSSDTASSSFWAWSPGNKRKPAVAFSTNGVFDQYSSGISFFAKSNNFLIESAP